MAVGAFLNNRRHAIFLFCLTFFIFLVWKRHALLCSYESAPVSTLRKLKPNSLLLRLKTKLFRDPANAVVFPYQIRNPLMKSPSKKEVVYSKLKPTIPCLSLKCGMYTHNFRDHVSNTINNTGVWEEKITNIFTSMLNYFSTAKFIDIGSNIGYYTIVASQMNRYCFAIEANPKNAAVLAKSILDNKLTQRVRLLNKAVGQYSGRNISLATEKGNMGNTIVQKNKSGKILDYNGKVNPNIKKTKYESVPTITLNDITDKYLKNFDIAIVKMDVQGAEYESLKSASKLFSKIYIPAVFFEWVNYQFATHQKEAAEIAKFFLSRGYKPYDPKADASLPLDHKKWSYDVIFMLE